MLSSELSKADYHVHPNYSLDATGSIDQYCRRALELGLREICFTTHYDSDPFRKDIDPFMRIDGKIVPLSEESVKRYIEDVKRADEEYDPHGLSVKVGLEVDYAPHIEEQLRKDLADFDLDYRLGSVHCLDHIAITASGEAGSYFKKKSAQEMVSEYYEYLRLAVESGLFDVMAHLDIYKKYGLGFYGKKILSAHRGLVESVLERMAENHLGLEINAGVLRRGQKEFSPGSEILQLALSIGVRIVALGSDAHEVNHLGRGIKEAYRLVKRLEGKEDLKGKTVTR
ncbi:MAG: histidinol-phosphatase HisJ family protein [candidate division Zixibacteria bacterium]|nr:histidinol-phosphatase HisJ family protein [candidate division Zixibacteria bacterium]